MAIKNISIGDSNFEVATSVGENCGFLFSLSAFYEDGRKDAAEVYVGIEEASQIIHVLEESIKFAKELKE